jgi:DNA-binding winged helix-turn-helix (wHTH) protein
MAVFRIGHVEFDTTAGEVRGPAGRVRLRPQPGAILAHLARRSGTLVPRWEFSRLLWGDHIHVNFDQGLNSCMKQIRRALVGAGGTNPIETLPRRGYRLLAEVEVVDANGFGALQGDPGSTAWAARLAELIADVLMREMAAGVGPDERELSGKIRELAWGTVAGAQELAGYAPPTCYGRSASANGRAGRSPREASH